VKCKLRLAHCCGFLWSFIHDSLGWSWQSTSLPDWGLNQWQHMMETCTSSDVLAGVLPFACSCAIVVLCTALFAVGVGLLLTCLLLLAWLLACPSPPGLAPGFSLSFSSWDELLVLLLLAWSWASLGLHGFAGCIWVMKWCCCGRTVMFFVVSNVSSFTWFSSRWCSPGRLLDVAGSCGAASTSFACSD
jgi:hypothetical protein